MKFCRSCKFFRDTGPNRGTAFMYCVHPAAEGELNLVTGERDTPKLCRVMREGEQLCGPSAKFYEPAGKTLMEVLTQ